MYQNHLQGLEKHIAKPTPRVSDTVGLGWDLSICIPHRLSGDGLGPHLRTVS